MSAWCRPALLAVVIALLASVGLTACYPTPKHVTTASDDPSAVDRDPMHSAAGRRRLRGAGCTNPGSGTSAYNANGRRVNGPTTAHFNAGNAPGGAASALQAAFNTWKAADANAPGISVATDSSVSSPNADHRYETVIKNFPDSNAANLAKQRLQKP